MRGLVLCVAGWSLASTGQAAMIEDDNSDYGVICGAAACTAANPYPAYGSGGFALGGLLKTDSFLSVSDPAKAIFAYTVQTNNAFIFTLTGAFLSAGVGVCGTFNGTLLTGSPCVDPASALYSATGCTANHAQCNNLSLNAVIGPGSVTFTIPQNFNGLVLYVSETCGTETLADPCTAAAPSVSSSSPEPSSFAFLVLGLAVFCGIRLRATDH